MLRPGGITMIGFHVGDARNHKTQGYGGEVIVHSVHREVWADYH